MTYYCITYKTADSKEYYHSVDLDEVRRPFTYGFSLAFANFDFFEKEDSFIGREI